MNYDNYSIIAFIKLLKNPTSNLLVRVYHKRKGRRVNMINNARKKYTLNEIGDALMSFRQEVNERFDRIETRLDYIVKANNLKDLSKGK